MNWPVTIEGITYRMDGRRVTMNRTVDAYGRDLEEVVAEAVASRKDEGWPFVGEGVVVTDSLGRQAKFIIEATPEGELFAEAD